MCSVLYFKGKKPSSRAILIKIFSQKVTKAGLFQFWFPKLDFEQFKKKFFFPSADQM